MTTMTTLTTEPKKVIPLAELSTLEAVFALRMPTSFFLCNAVNLCRAAPGLEEPVEDEGGGVGGDVPEGRPEEPGAGVEVRRLRAQVKEGRGIPYVAAAIHLLDHHLHQDSTTGHQAGDHGGGQEDIRLR